MNDETGTLYTMNYPSGTWIRRINEIEMVTCTMEFLDNDEWCEMISGYLHVPTAVPSGNDHLVATGYEAGCAIEPKWMLLGEISCPFLESNQGFSTVQLSVSQPLWDRGPVHFFFTNEGPVTTNLLVNTFPFF